MNEINEKLSEDIRYLFECDFFAEEFDPDGEEVHSDRAEDIKEQFDEQDILTCALTYFFNNCKDAKQIYNYCNLFFYYGFCDIKNEDALKFLGYIYYMVDFDKEPEMFDFVDMFSCKVVEQNKLASLYENPYYRPDKDKRILDAVEIWKNI